MPRSVPAHTAAGSASRPCSSFDDSTSSWMSRSSPAAGRTLFTVSQPNAEAQPSGVDYPNSIGRASKPPRQNACGSGSARTVTSEGLERAGCEPARHAGGSGPTAAARPSSGPGSQAPPRYPSDLQQRHREANEIGARQARSLHRLTIDRHDTATNRSHEGRSDLLRLCSSKLPVCRHESWMRSRSSSAR